MSDVFHLWTKKRIPSVYYGPGLLSQCHVANEWIATDDIVRAARIYALVARNAVAPGLDDQTVLSAIDDDRVVALAQELVRIPSENPPGGEEPAQNYIATWLARFGYDARRVDSPDGRPNLLFERGNAANGPTLLFNGHVDVVPSGPDWSRDPFSGDIENGRLHGRGAADMKGGVAAILEVAAVFAQLDPDLAGRLAWTVVADEEAGGEHGTGFLCDAGHIDADMAVVAEPSEFRLSVSENTLMWMRFETRGRQEHTINRAQAVNAVEAMMPVADGLLRFRDEIAGLKHAKLGSPILTINTLHGGLKSNIVPDRCTMEVDLRYPAGLGLDIDSVRARIDAMLGRLRADDPTLDVRYAVHGKPGFEQPEDTDVVRHIRAAHESVVGAPPEWWRRGS